MIFKKSSRNLIEVTPHYESVLNRVVMFSYKHVMYIIYKWSLGNIDKFRNRLKNSLKIINTKKYYNFKIDTSEIHHNYIFGRVFPSQFKGEMLQASLESLDVELGEDFVLKKKKNY